MREVCRADRGAIVLP